MDHLNVTNEIYISSLKGETAKKFLSKKDLECDSIFFWDGERARSKFGDMIFFQNFEQVGVVCLAKQKFSPLPIEMPGEQSLFDFFISPGFLAEFGKG